MLEMRHRKGLAVFLTTHYLDEAEHCDRVAIIDNGSIVALDTPSRLKDMVGGDVVSLRVESERQEHAIAELRGRFALELTVADGAIQFNVPHAEQFLPEFIRGFSLPLQAVSLHRPTLEDAFLKLTGHAIRDDTPGAAVSSVQRVKAGRR